MKKWLVNEIDTGTALPECAYFSDAIFNKKLPQIRRL